MSRAIRAASAKERAQIAAEYIRSGRDTSNSRGFSDCFEMGDGDQVIAHLREMVKRSPKLAANISKYLVGFEAPRGAPCTGGIGHIPIYDRHGEHIHVGDKLRVQHCVGRYGQTKIEEMTVTEAHWTYCSHGVASTEYDFAANVLRCKHTRHDFEHGHDTWAEIVK